MSKKPSQKEIREQQYKENSQRKFAEQRRISFKPNIICFIAEAILLIILMIWDSPAVVFDESSSLFMYMLIGMTAIPLINLFIIFIAKNTTYLLVAMSLNQLCIIPLIIGFLVKYDELNNCSSYHMLVMYFAFLIAYLAMTTSMFSLKSSKISSLEGK